MRKSIKIKISLIIVILLACYSIAKAKTQDKRDDIINLPQNYINKEVTLNLVFHGLDTKQSIVVFMPDRVKGPPRCRFEIQYADLKKEYIDKIKKGETDFRVTFIITKVEIPTKPLGLHDYRKLIRGELVDMAPLGP